MVFLSQLYSITDENTAYHTQSIMLLEYIEALQIFNLVLAFEKDSDGFIAKIFQVIFELLGLVSVKTKFKGKTAVLPQKHRANYLEIF